MMYIAEKHGKCLPTDPAKRAEVINWVMWQMVRYYGELLFFVCNVVPFLGEHCC